MSQVLLGGFVQDVQKRKWSDRACENRTHDFGCVLSDAKCLHKFEISNPSDVPLLVRAVQSSCGCVQPSIDSKQIAVGGKAILVAAVDTSNFYGEKKATITLRLDQPPREIQFSVAVNIQSFSIKPACEVSFNGVKPGAAATRTIKVERKGEPDWEIKGVKSSSPSLIAKVTQRDVIDTSAVHHMEIQFHSSKEIAKPFQEWLTIETNDDSRPEERIPVWIQGETPKITCAMEAVLFTRSDLADAQTQRIVIVTAKPSELSMLNVIGEGYAAAAVTRGSSKAHIIEVTISKQRLKKNTNEKCRLIVETKAGLSLELPIVLERE